MACDCSTIFDLGCIDTCGTVTFGTATQTGAHIIRIYIGDKVLKETITVNLGASIEITDDGSRYSGGFTYIANIENPDGSEFTRPVTGQDCFQFEVRKIITVA